MFSPANSLKTQVVDFVFEQVCDSHHLYRKPGVWFHSGSHQPWKTSSFMFLVYLSFVSRGQRDTRMIEWPKFKTLQFFWWIKYKLLLMSRLNKQYYFPSKTHDGLQLFVNAPLPTSVSNYLRQPTSRLEPFTCNADNCLSWSFVAKVHCRSISLTAYNRMSEWMN